MRILLIMTPGIPVPPVLYGGVERVVYLLAEEYNRLGHEVTLLAGAGSYCSGTFIPIANKKVFKLMSYQREVSPKGIKMITSLPNRNLVFTGCSKYCVSTGNVA